MRRPSRRLVREVAGVAAWCAMVVYVVASLRSWQLAQRVLWPGLLAPALISVAATDRAGCALAWCQGRLLMRRLSRLPYAGAEGDRDAAGPS